MENIYKINGEAVKKIAERVYDNGSTVINRNDLEEMFPELKESEDEKIRKWIIAYLENRVMNTSITDEKDNCLNAIRWLEKQGEQKPVVNDNAKEMFIKALERVEEQNNKGYKLTDCDKNSWWEDFKAYTSCIIEHKPTDKVEPKFKIGDFIVNDYCMGKVIELTNDAYLLDTGQGIPFSHEHNAHLWTIQDAKGGDVLVAHECLVLFKEIDGLNIRCYCTYHFMNNESFFVDTLQNKTAFTPATKEQRDLLFQKMKEAGYEWDAEKKELKKIEQKSDNWIQELEDKLANTTPKQLAEWKEKYFKEEPVWSEEDDEMYKEVLTDIIYAKNDLEAKECFGLSKRAMEAFNWFSKRYKSLRPQTTWKPSMAQLNALSIVSKGNISDDIEAIVSLYNDLKKLTE